ncbi:hypothetical protein [Streptomyces sp. NPDC002851]
MVPPSPAVPPPVRRRRLRLPSLLLATALVLLVSGCVDAEGLRSDGQAEDVTSPLRLWRDTTPAPAPPGQHPGDPGRVPGVPKVPSRAMSDADALAVVKADIADAGRRDGGSGQLVDPRAVRLLERCEGADCPVRKPVHHDLTGDRRDELITAVDIDGRTSELRVYTARDKTVTRVLARRAVLEGVEVAAGHLAVREPTSNPKYVSVSDYVWEDGEDEEGEKDEEGDATEGPDGADGKGLGSMALWDLTLDECRAPETSGKPCPSLTPGS